MLTRNRVNQPTWRLPHMTRTHLLIGMVAMDENDLPEFLLLPLSFYVPQCPHPYQLLSLD